MGKYQAVSKDRSNINHGKQNCPKAKQKQGIKKVGDSLKQVLLQYVEHGFELAEDECSMLIDDELSRLASSRHTNTTVQEQLSETRTRL
jgi:hypothetical protein